MQNFGIASPSLARPRDLFLNFNCRCAFDFQLLTFSFRLYYTSFLRSKKLCKISAAAEASAFF